MTDWGTHLATMRQTAPLVQNITNYVAMNVMANVLLAAGASPAMVHAEEGDLARALETFQRALAARERIGDPARTRVARWMVAWTLRRLGRADEARTMQLALREEHRAAGTSDVYVEEELALLGPSDERSAGDTVEGRTPER